MHFKTVITLKQYEIDLLKSIKGEVVNCIHFYGPSTGIGDNRNSISYQFVIFELANKIVIIRSIPMNIMFGNEQQKFIIEKVEDGNSVEQWKRELDSCDRAYKIPKRRQRDIQEVLTDICMERERVILKLEDEVIELERDSVLSFEFGRSYRVCINCTAVPEEWINVYEISNSEINRNENDKEGLAESFIEYMPFKAEHYQELTKGCELLEYKSEIVNL